MKKTFVFVFALLLMFHVQFVPAHAQMHSSVRAEIIGNGFTENEIFKNMEYLSLDIGGRITGTEACNKAEDFVKDRFEAYGLKNVKKEPYNFLGWNNKSILVEVLQPVKKVLNAVALGNTPSTPPQGLVKQIVNAGHGYKSEFAARKDEIKDSFVLIDTGSLPGQKWLHRSEKMTFAEEFGAAGFIMMNNTEGSIPRSGTVKMGILSKIPGIGIAKEDGEWIRGLLKQGIPVELKIMVINESDPAIAHNITGEIQGNEKPDEVVLVGGHLDSWEKGQGTFDNGAGTEVILEAARLLARLDVKPKRTIRFVSFTGEELGIYGSRAYVEKHKPEINNIRIMMNLDMPGEPYRYSIIGKEEAIGFFKNLARSLDNLGMDPERIGNGWYLHSDHQYFMLAGVPCISLASSLRPNQGRYYHTAGDTFDKFTKEDQIHAAIVTAITLFELADMDELPFTNNSDEAVYQAMMKNGLKDPLVQENAWKWNK